MKMEKKVKCFVFDGSNASAGNIWSWHQDDKKLEVVVLVVQNGIRMAEMVDASHFGVGFQL